MVNNKFKKVGIKSWVTYQDCKRDHNNQQSKHYNLENLECICKSRCRWSQMCRWLMLCCNGRKRKWLCSCSGNSSRCRRSQKSSQYSPPRKRNWCCSKGGCRTATNMRRREEMRGGFGWEWFHWAGCCTTICSQRECQLLFKVERKERRERRVTIELRTWAGRVQWEWLQWTGCRTYLCSYGSC